MNLAAVTALAPSISAMDRRQAMRTILRHYGVAGLMLVLRSLHRARRRANTQKNLCQR